MKTIKHSASFFTFVSIFALILYLLDTTGLLTLKIGTAHPLLLIPFLVAVSMTAREWVGLVFGALFGVMLDITAANSFCFNLVIMLIIGCVCGLLCSFVVNDNIYSSILLSLAAGLFYFVVKWLWFYVFSGRGEAFNYFITYALPSAAYTALFILPFYYLVKFVSKKTYYIV